MATTISLSSRFIWQPTVSMNTRFDIRIQMPSGKMKGLDRMTRRAGGGCTLLKTLRPEIRYVDNRLPLRSARRALRLLGSHGSMLLAPPVGALPKQLRSHFGLQLRDDRIPPPAHQPDKCQDGDVGCDQQDRHVPCIHLGHHTIPPAFRCKVESQILHSGVVLSEREFFPPFVGE